MTPESVMTLGRQAMEVTPMISAVNSIGADHRPDRQYFSSRDSDQ